MAAFSLSLCPSLLKPRFFKEPLTKASRVCVSSLIDNSKNRDDLYAWNEKTMPASGSILPSFSIYGAFKQTNMSVTCAHV